MADVLEWQVIPSMPTSDAIEIIHRRYYANRPDREVALQQERAKATGTRRVLKTPPCPLAVLQDILLLVDEDVSLAWLKRRTVAERAELERWARKVHAVVSDVPVRVSPRTACLPLRLQLSERDSRRVQALLQHPPKPTARLRRAAKTLPPKH